MKAHITASPQGLADHLRDMAAGHHGAAAACDTQRAAAREKGIAEGLEIAARLVANATFVDEDSTR